MPVADDWERVVRAREHVGRALVSPLVTHGFVMPGLANLAHAILLFYAYSVLERALSDARDAGRFKCTSNNLEPLMTASRSVLAWQDFALVDRGRDARNAVAHRFEQPIDRSAVLGYVDAIARELAAWGLVPPSEPVPTPG